MSGQDLRRISGQADGELKNAREEISSRGQSAENPLRGFSAFFAVCCAQELYAFGAQFPHLQPDMYFCPRTRRGQK